VQIATKLKKTERKSKPAGKRPKPKPKRFGHTGTTGFTQEIENLDLKVKNEG